MTTAARSIDYVRLAAQQAPVREELLAAVGAVLDHGWFINGPEVKAFEERFAALCGARYAVGVNSGTDALVLAIKAMEIGEGDEVITAPNSFLASASAIVLAGATPVFADVRDDQNIDPEQIERAITPKTRAILPVHLTGRPADMDAINAIADRHDLKVIEDAAQAVGARCHDQPVGSLGDAAAFSLHPLKNLAACGDGGVITTSDPDVYEYLTRARNHGLRNRDECAFWSLNSRLDTVQAAMLLVKLDHLDEWTAARRAHAAAYRAALDEVVFIPPEKPHEHNVYHAFVIQTPQRDELMAYLKDRGIDAKIHYPIPIHRQDAAAEMGLAAGSYPVCERQTGQILSLPVSPELSGTERECVIEAVTGFFRSA